MGDEEKKKGWFYTLPGIITTLTAVVTALSGLAVAVKDTSWLH